MISASHTDSAPLKIISDFIAKNKGRKSFPEYEIKRLLKDLGLAVPNGIIISRGEVTSPLHNLSYPLIVKVSSSKIISKSDVGGVRAAIGNEEELKKAVTELLRIENAEGVLIEEMATKGLEVIVGGVIDRQFGPVVMFGIGGIFVELFKDTAFALALLSKDDALWLIEQVKGFKLIEGYRGNPALDKDSLIKIILAVSEIMASGLVEEIDLNPIALYPKGAIVLDAKMSVKS